ncbi:hypothetical protein STEG23_002490 [Scotinomys teguina]
MKFAENGRIYKLQYYMRKRRRSNQRFGGSGDEAQNPSDLQLSWYLFAKILVPKAADPGFSILPWILGFL